MGLETNQYQLINAITHQVIPDCKILLFGSRAKGSNSADSDYDLLIITSGDLSISEKMRVKAKLRRLFAKANIDADLIVESSKEIEKKKNISGHIVRYALREAVAI